MEDQHHELFSDFMRRRQDASGDYIRGDAHALSGMLTARDPATFMPPGGAVIQGAAAAADAQTRGAAAFGPASQGSFEILSSGHSGDLAYWTGRQLATMDILGHDQPVPMVLRTTEIFRREDGRWRLIHRHADIPTPAQ